MTCPGATDIISQDDTVVNLEIRTIPNQTTGDFHETEPMPEEIQSIYEAG